MKDQDIDIACEALRRVLRSRPDCRYGRIEGIIAKGRVKDLVLLPEVTGMRNGEIVAPADGDQEDGR